jgi:hypothetical protein
MSRASGESDAEHAAKEQGDALTEEMQLVRPGQPDFRTPKFMRMRFNWGDDDERRVVQTAQEVIQNVLLREFTDAYRIQTDIQTVVRIQETDEVTGMEIFDDRGQPVWVMNDSGYPYEDWTRMTIRQIESYLGIITTRLFAWEQTAARMWTDAMLAKARFEERFAIAYGESGKRTVDDRTAAGNEDAAEERYHAVFLTGLSRRADALVRSMDRLSQRLKDLLVSR